MPSTISSEKRRVSSSFRDPSGFVYWRNGTLYRQINPSYTEDYKKLMASGLYSKLISDRLLVSHNEINENTIKPEIIPFISYPYEWCFSQLKDAAIATLTIEKIAMDFGMTLKDASAYNMQFLRGRPILIDSLSFEIYREGEPWLPYKQFCQHFLNPLALMAYKDIRLSQLLRIYIDGIPSDLTAMLLPLKAYTKLALLAHIKAHALGQRHLASKKIPTGMRMSKVVLIGFMNNLETIIRKLEWQPKGGWASYNQCSYSKTAQQNKQDIVTKYLGGLELGLIWDMGSNNGLFSNIAAELGAEVIALDSDPACIEICYRQYRNKLLPLVIDIANPTPSIGWRNEERMSLLERNKPDTVIVLALIHHLAISNNLPLGEIANFFSELSGALVIEFIPKGDAQVQKLLSTRQDIFVDYNQKNFEIEFSRYFRIVKSERIKDSLRTLYLMVKE